MFSWYFTSICQMVAASGGLSLCVRGRMKRVRFLNSTHTLAQLRWWCVSGFVRLKRCIKHDSVVVYWPKQILELNQTTLSTCRDSQFKTRCWKPPISAPLHTHTHSELKKASLKGLRQLGLPKRLSFPSARELEMDSRARPLFPQRKANKRGGENTLSLYSIL